MSYSVSTSGIDLRVVIPDAQYVCHKAALAVVLTLLLCWLLPAVVLLLSLL
jgi:hypothetical protein